MINNQNLHKKKQTTHNHHPPTGRVRGALRENAIFYSVAGALLLIYLIVVAAEQNFNWDEFVGYAICLSNT